MKLWKRILIAAFVGFLYYFAQISASSHDINRYHYQWQFRDVIAIQLGIAVFTLLAVAADAVVRRVNSTLLRRLFNHLFLLFFTGGVLTAFGYLIPSVNLVLLLWMPAMFLIGYSFAQPDKQLYRYAEKFCLFLSPGAFIILISMYFWSTWPNPRGSLPPAAAEAPNKTPVFFFVFDEWSYHRSCEKDEIKPVLKNIHKLADQSVFFTRALSPTVMTEQSIPRYLFQTNETFAVANDETYFETAAGPVPTRQFPSIFRLARENGYRSSILGFFHSYRQLLDEDVDYCHVYSHYYANQDDNFFNDFLWRAAWISQFSYDPISLQLKIPNRISSRQWYKTGSEYRKEMLGILGRSTTNEIAFFHVPWPHYPFVFNPNGSYFGTTWDLGRAADYLRHLDFLDLTVGEIVAQLKASGHYDEALLILTSDHGWRSDLNYTIQSIPEFRRRIPLIVKLPGEKTGHRIHAEFSPNQLKPLLQAVFSGEKDPQVLLKTLERGEQAKGPPPPEI
jgi:hypothetical protein